MILCLIRRWLDERRAKAIIEDQKRQLGEILKRMAWDAYMEAETQEEILYWHREIRNLR